MPGTASRTAKLSTSYGPTVIRGLASQITAPARCRGAIAVGCVTRTSGLTAACHCLKGSSALPTGAKLSVGRTIRRRALPCRRRALRRRRRALPRRRRALPRRLLSRRPPRRRRRQALPPSQPLRHLRAFSSRRSHLRLCSLDPRYLWCWFSSRLFCAAREGRALLTGSESCELPIQMRANGRKAKEVEEEEEKEEGV